MRVGHCCAHAVADPKMAKQMAAAIQCFKATNVSFARRAFLS
jgi:hypothetical protein